MCSVGDLPLWPDRAGLAPSPSCSGPLPSQTVSREPQWTPGACTTSLPERSHAGLQTCTVRGREGGREEGREGGREGGRPRGKRERGSEGGKEEKK